MVVSFFLARVRMGGLWSSFPLGGIGGWVVVSIPHSTPQGDEDPPGLKLGLFGEGGRERADPAGSPAGSREAAAPQ